MKKLIFLILVLHTAIMLHAQEDGEVSIYFFLNGKPEKNIRVKIDGGEAVYSNGDGVVRKTLAAGRHVLKATGTKKVHAVANFIIVLQENTRVIITLKKGDNSEIEIEHPKNSRQKLKRKRKKILNLELLKERSNHLKVADLLIKSLFL